MLSEAREPGRQRAASAEPRQGGEIQIASGMSRCRRPLQLARTPETATLSGTLVRLASVRRCRCAKAGSESSCQMASAARSSPTSGSLRAVCGSRRVTGAASSAKLSTRSYRHSSSSAVERHSRLTDTPARSRCRRRTLRWPAAAGTGAAGRRAGRPSCRAAQAGAQRRPPLCTLVSARGERVLLERTSARLGRDWGVGTRCRQNSAEWARAGCFRESWTPEQRAPAQRHSAHVARRLTSDSPACLSLQKLSVLQGACVLSLQGTVGEQPTWNEDRWKSEARG